jgi:hypothetical protein
VATASSPIHSPIKAHTVRHDLAALVCLLLLYVLLAYVILPDWWRLRRRHWARTEDPKTTRTAQGLAGDPLNVVLFGTEEEVVRALLAAGWHPADPITLRSSLRISRSVIFNQAYADAPVSNLYLWGRRQDLAFERTAGKSPRHRHHVRFWRSEEFSTDDRPVWLGAATYDQSVGLSHYTAQVTHHIGPNVDAERDLLIQDLIRAGQLERTYLVPGVGPTQHGRNGGGDRYRTDGYRQVGVLRVD